MRLEDLLAELEQAQNLPNLKLDEQGICLLQHQSALVAVEKTPDGQGFYVYSAIGKVPPAKEKKLSIEALSGNLFGRGTGKASLGYLPQSNTLVLFQYVIEEGTSLPLFQKILEEFTAYLKIWHQKLEETEELTEAVVHSRMMPRSGGMQIFFA